MSRRLIPLTCLIFVSIIPTWAAPPNWLSPENLPAQLKHPLQLLATTAMSGEGKDFFTLKPGQTATIGTITGPAIIFRTWSTSSKSAMVSLDMIVDGKKELLYEKGRLPAAAPQPDPLRGMDKQAYWSYIPVFVKQQAVFKARSSEKTEEIKFYLQAGYRTVTAAELAEARTLNLKEMRSLARGFLTGSPELQAGATMEGQVRVGQPWTPALQGPTLVTSLRLRAAGLPEGTSPTPAQLQATRLVVTCDGSKTIDAPIGSLFGVAHKLADYSSAGLAVHGGALELRFPLPIAGSITVALEPFGRGGLTQMAARVTATPLKQAPKYRLCAQYFSQISVMDQPMTLLSVTGEGIFLGTNLSANGMDRKTFAFLEGNEQFYVDGATKPTIEGTGTEDYFNAAWYFEAGEKAHLFHGVTFKQDREPPMVDCYRQMVSDCVPFKTSFRFDLQHGSRNKAPDVRYEGVNFWYQAPPVNVAEPVAAQPAAAPTSLQPSRDAGAVHSSLLGTVLILAFVFIAAFLMLHHWRKRRRS